MTLTCAFWWCQEFPPDTLNDCNGQDVSPDRTSRRGIVRLRVGLYEVGVMNTASGQVISG